MAEEIKVTAVQRADAFSFVSKRKGLRAISLGTLFVFLVNTAASNIIWAAPGFEMTLTRIQESPFASLPQKLGVVRAYQPSPRQAPFILHIQDAHSNPSAQKNIAKILQWIYEQNLQDQPIIALEGVKGSLHPEYLNFFPGHPKVNRSLVRRLVNQGELTGAELFAWNKIAPSTEHRAPGDKQTATAGKQEPQGLSPHPQGTVPSKPSFIGVEEPALYRENLGIYREFLDHETEIKKALDVLRGELSQLENNTLSKEAREYLREKRRRKDGDYQTGHNHPQWEAYLTYLKNELNEQVKLDLEAPFEQIRFPNVVRLDVLMRAFKDLNLEAAAKERESFLNDLGHKVRTEKDKETVKAFKESAHSKNLRELSEKVWGLAISYRIDPKAAVEFWRMTGRDILQTELDVIGLNQEINQLEGWLEGSLADSEEAKKVFKQGHDFDLLKKTLSLELTAKQLEVKGNGLSPLPQGTVPGVGRSFDSVFALTPDYEVKKTLTPWIQKSARFYELAIQRDKILLDNTLKAAQGSRAAVLITGGFHTDGFKRLMQERGIGYAVIQPKMDASGENLYRKVLREENADVSAYFEKTDMNRQEALFFKSIVENGAAELWEKEKVSHQEIAAEAAEAIRVHPVFKDRLDARATPEGKQGSRLDLQEFPSSSPTVQAVVVTPITNGVEFFRELDPRHAVAKGHALSASITYQPVGTSVRIKPESRVSTSRTRAEVRVEKAHHYAAAAEEERQRVLAEIKKATAQGVVEYGVRFLKGVKKTGTQLEIGLPSEDEWREAEKSRVAEETYDFSPQRVFHEGLLKDEKGVYWIAKKLNLKAREAWVEDRETKNYPERERLAFLLAQGRANLTEIRLMDAQEAEQGGLTGDPSHYYLTRVVTPSNYSARELPHQDWAKAYAGLFVANILMRKFDPHLFNVGHVGPLPVALDHDGSLSFDDYSNDVQNGRNVGFERFVTAFLIHSVVKITRHLKPSDPTKIYLDDMFALNDVLSANYFLGWQVIENMATGLGLGDGYIEAEGLTAENIRQSISDFKNLKNVRVLAEQAGYKGEALEAVTRFIEENQLRLGQDVDFLWQRLTGRSAGLQDLDQAQSGSENSLTDARSEVRFFEEGKATLLKIQDSDPRLTELARLAEGMDLEEAVALYLEAVKSYGRGSGASGRYETWNPILLQKDRDAWTDIFHNRLGIFHFIRFLAEGETLEDEDWSTVLEFVPQVLALKTIEDAILEGQPQEIMRIYDQLKLARSEVRTAEKKLTPRSPEVLAARRLVNDIAQGAIGRGISLLETEGRPLLEALRTQPTQETLRRAEEFIQDNNFIFQIHKPVTLNQVREVLDSRPHAVWYAHYDGTEESVEYANQVFANVFGRSTPQEILKARSYLAINPPGAPVEQYKTEDQIALHEGLFMSRSGNPAVTVVKVEFESGVLGFFMEASKTGTVTLDNLEPELLQTLREVRPDLFSESVKRSEVRQQDEVLGALRFSLVSGLAEDLNYQSFSKAQEEWAAILNERWIFQSDFQSRMDQAVQRGWVEPKAKSGHYRLRREAIPTELLFQAEAAREAAKEFGSDEPVRTFRQFYEGREAQGKLLASFPAEKIIYDFLLLPTEDPAYQETWRALSLNWSLFAFAQIRALYDLMPASSRRKDLLPALEAIPFQAAKLQTEGGNYEMINRRTWSGRYRFDRLDSELARFEAAQGDASFRIGDFAVSDGRTAVDLARHVEQANVRVTASDYRKNFFIHNMTAFDEDGTILQVRKRGTSRLYERRDVDPEARDETESLYARALARGQIGDHVRRVSLIHPDVESYALKHPGVFEIRRDDIFNPNEDQTYHFIRVMGLLMPGDWSYFSDEKISEALTALGRRLEEGGALEIGMSGGQTDQFALYRRSADRLRVETVSGFSNYPQKLREINLRSEVRGAAETDSAWDISLEDDGVSAEDALKNLFSKAEVFYRGFPKLSVGTELLRFFIERVNVQETGFANGGLLDDFTSRFAGLAKMSLRDRYQFLSKTPEFIPVLAEALVQQQYLDHRGRWNLEKIYRDQPLAKADQIRLDLTAFEEQALWRDARRGFYDSVRYSGLIWFGWLAVIVSAGLFVKFLLAANPNPKIVGLSILSTLVFGLFEYAMHAAWKEKKQALDRRSQKQVSKIQMGDEVGFVPSPWRPDREVIAQVTAVRSDERLDLRYARVHSSGQYEQVERQGVVPARVRLLSQVPLSVRLHEYPSARSEVRMDGAAEPRVIKAVQTWLGSGTVGFKDVPEATVFHLIAPDSRLASIEALIKKQAGTRELNKKQRLRRDTLAQALATVIDQAAAEPAVSERGNKFFTPIPKASLEKWAEIFDAEFFERRDAGRGRYPFPLSALQDYGSVMRALSASQSEDEHELLIAGFSQRGTRSQTVGLNFAGQQQDLLEAKLLRIKGGSSLPTYAGSGFFETQPDATIPFIGSFYRQDGTEVSPEELAAAGLEWVQDASGQDVKFPVFASTTAASRVAVVPLPVPRMIVILDDHEFRLLGTKAEFEGFITEKFGPEPFVRIKQDAAERAQKITASASSVLSARAQDDLQNQAYLTALVSFLKDKNYKHAMPIVALRYKGIGTRYNFQPAVASDFAKRHDDHQREVSKSEHMARLPEGWMLIKDQRLEGKSGIFLFPYQEGSLTAMGAESDEVLRAIQNDRALFLNGATLSTLNVAAVEMASGQTLRQWGVSTGVHPLYVVVQVVTDDTRNLLEISNFFDIYLTTEIDKDLATARKKYLENFLQFFGHNIAAIIKSNLTFSANDLSVLEESGMVRNISPLGNLRDTGELGAVKQPQESMRVLLSMISTAFFVGKLNGFSDKAWVNSRYFDELIGYFLEEFKGSEELRSQTIKKIQSYKKILSESGPRQQGAHRAFVAVVTRQLFEYWTRAEGVKAIDALDQEFMAHIEGDPEREAFKMLAVSAAMHFSSTTSLVSAGNKKSKKRSEVRNGGMEGLREALGKSTNALTWHNLLSGDEPADAQDKVDVTLQIARGIQMKVPMLRSVLNDSELQESAYRYLAVWAYNASIIYGTSFVAAGVEGEPDLVNAERIKALLTTGELSNIRESLTKGDENPLGIKNYASAGKEIDIKPLSQLIPAEKETRPVALDIQLLTHVPGVYLGIDVGGGSAKITVIQNGVTVSLPDELRVISTVLFEADGTTAIFESPEAYVERMSDRVRAIVGYLSQTYGIQKLDGVGINTPGAADFEANRMETLGQMPVKKEWNQTQTQQVGRELPRQIANMLGLPENHVRIRNDMDGVLPGVAAVLAKVKPDFWNQTSGNFAFDWMGTGHGFQFALSGVPMNAPTEAGHMIFDFSAKEGKVFDTEAFTSIPSMLSWARELANSENVDWSEIQGDQLKPLADAVFYGGKDTATLQKKAIAQKVVERFAKNYAMNLALRYHMVQSTGHGSAMDILLGGGVARGQTGAYLRVLTLLALDEYGLGDNINITVITDEEIRAAGVDPDDVGPMGAAYFIQSALAGEKRSEVRSPSPSQENEAELPADEAAQKIWASMQTRTPKEVWKMIKLELETHDPNIAQKHEGYLPRLYHALKRNLYEIQRKQNAGEIHTEIPLETFMYRDNPVPAAVPLELDRPLRIGFLPVAGNPINWGHILIALVAMNRLKLDRVIIRIQGEINYKNVPESDKVSAEDRHALGEDVLSDFSPLLSYADVGLRDDHEGMEGMFEFSKALNQDKNIQFFYILGSETEKRTTAYMDKLYEQWKKFPEFGQAANRNLEYVLMQRGEFGRQLMQKRAVELMQNAAEKAEAQTVFPVHVLRGRDVDLNIASTFYREGGDDGTVPRKVHEFGVKHQRWGNVVDTEGRLRSRTEVFREHLLPTEHKIFEAMLDRMRAKPGTDVMGVFAFDGPSGAGKSTVADELDRAILREGGGLAAFSGVRGAGEYVSKILDIDLFLKPRKERQQIERYVAGEEKDPTEKILPKTYLDENDFFREKAIKKLFREIQTFRRSGLEEQEFVIRNPYIRRPATDTSPLPKEYRFTLKRNTILLVVGKYVLDYQIPDFYDAAFRIKDEPGRNIALFQKRVRFLNPKDEIRQIIFYERALQPSYEHYARRTDAYVTYDVDLTREMFELRPHEVTQTLKSTPDQILQDTRFLYEYNVSTLPAKSRRRSGSLSLDEAIHKARRQWDTAALMALLRLRELNPKTVHGNLLIHRDRGDGMLLLGLPSVGKSLTSSLIHGRDGWELGSDDAFQVLFVENQMIAGLDAGISPASRDLQTRVPSMPKGDPAYSVDEEADYVRVLKAGQPIVGVEKFVKVRNIFFLWPSSSFPGLTQSPLTEIDFFLRVSGDERFKQFPMKVFKWGAQPRFSRVEVSQGIADRMLDIAGLRPLSDSPNSPVQMIEIPARRDAARSEVRTDSEQGGSDFRERRREQMRRAAGHEDEAIAAFETMIREQKKPLNLDDALEFFGQFLSSIDDRYKSDVLADAHAVAAQGLRAYLELLSYREKGTDVVAPYKSSDQPVFEGFPAGRSELIVVTRDRPGLTAVITGAVQSNIVRDWAVFPAADRKERVMVMVFEMSRDDKSLGFGALGRISEDVRTALSQTASLAEEKVLEGRQTNAQGIYHGRAAVLQGFGYGVSEVVYDIYAGLNEMTLEPAEREKRKLRLAREDAQHFYRVMEEMVLPLIEALPATLGLENSQVQAVLEFVKDIEEDVIREQDTYRQHAGVTQYRRSALSRFLKRVQLRGIDSGLPRGAIKEIDRMVLHALKERFFIFDPSEMIGHGQLELVDQQKDRLNTATEQVLTELEKTAEANARAVYEMVRMMVPSMEAEIQRRNILAEEAVTNLAIKAIRKLQRSKWDKDRANAADFQDVFTRIILALRGNSTNLRGEVMGAESGSEIILFARHVNRKDIADRLEEFRDRVQMIVTDDADVTKDSHWVQMADNDFGVPTLILQPGTLETVLKTDIVGEAVSVDAGGKRVYLRPSSETKERLGGQTDLFRAIDQAALETMSRLARTTEGVEVNVRASAESPEQIQTAMQQGAAGVGLGRTEYMIDVEAPEFKAWLASPSAENRRALIQYFTVRFRDMLESVTNINSRMPTTLRTYDFERDKDLKLPNPDKQYGPAFYATPIGRELLKIELLGMLEAGLDQPQSLRIMFPAFRNPIDLKHFLDRETLEDLSAEEQDLLDEQAREDIDLMNQVLDEAFDEIEVMYPDKKPSARRQLGQVQTGFMIETMEGVRNLEHILESADFISVGTTDMTISLFRHFENISRDNPEHSLKFSELQPEFMEIMRTILIKVSAWNTAHKTDISVDFCGGLAGVDAVLLGLIQAKPDNVKVGISRSPRVVAATKLWIRQVEQGADNQTDAVGLMERVAEKLRKLPEVTAAFEQIQMERVKQAVETDAGEENGNTAYQTRAERDFAASAHTLPAGFSAEKRIYQLGPKGFHVTPVPSIIKALKEYPDVQVSLVVDGADLNVRDPFEMMALGLPPKSLMELKLVGPEEQIAPVFDILENLQDITTVEFDADNNIVPGSGFLIFEKPEAPSEQPVEPPLQETVSVLPEGPTSTEFKDMLLADGAAVYREASENGKAVFMLVRAEGSSFRFVQQAPTHLTVWAIDAQGGKQLVQNILSDDPEYGTLSLFLNDLAIARSELRRAQPYSVDSVEADRLTFEALLRKDAATAPTEQAALSFVRAHQLGRSKPSEETQAVAAQASHVYASPESIAERLNPSVLEVYGSLIRVLLEDVGEDASQMAKVRDLVTRYLGEYAKVLEGATEVNYQYLDLVDVSELNEDTAYALAILSVVRPRGDEIRLYVSGDDTTVQERIHFVANSYEKILRKFGAPGRANLKMINVSSWENEMIQKDMLGFATGKNGKIQAAILSVRADFLEAIQVMKNTHRMNSAEVSGARALLFSPALLAQELDKRTLDVLQMKDELERLGLGALLSEHFAQMIAEVKLLAASA